MAATTLFWHDYETFGRVPRRDRPAQFAGIRTDVDLNEIGEPVMWHCQPATDMLPDPESVLLTGILPQHALQHGLPEHAFAAAIHAELSHECTVGVGYNSIRFDDEVTRFLFWRNLIDPYAREWQDGCGRWDLLDVVRCCWALRPEGIVWPTQPVDPVAAGAVQGLVGTVSGSAAGGGADRGAESRSERPSFKLEHLTAANGIGHIGAHDALADVRATLALARLVKSRQPRLWDFCFKLRCKRDVADEIGSGRPFVHVSGMYPHEHGCLAIVWPLAMHPTNRNELIVWDLAHDPRELALLDADTVRRRLFTRQSELPEGESRLPIKTVHLNKSPVVVGNLGVLGAAAGRWNIDVAAALRHAEHAAALGSTLDAVWAQAFQRPAAVRTLDVDEDLYGGFVGDEDRRLLEQLRTFDPDRLAAARPAFADGRLDELLFRYRARNFIGTLTEDELDRWEHHRAERLHRGAGGVLTLGAYFERIDVLAEAAAETGDERAQTLLEALYDHAEAMAPEVP